MPASDAGLWAPLQYDSSLPAQGREWGHHLRTIGRLSAGQIDKVREALPEEVRMIWSEPGTQDSSGRATADPSARSKNTSH